MRYYVYKIIDVITNEFYFGSRQCPCDPIDDNYMGSMKTWKPNKDNLIKEIIKNDFKNRVDAYDYENKIIKKYIKNKLNRNYHCNNNFHTSGRKVPEEQKERQSKKMIGKMSGENHPMYGKQRLDMRGNNNPAKRKEVREKISKRTRGSRNGMYGKYGKLNPMSKSILQYSKENIFIREWESAHMAANAINIYQPNITSCCTGKLRTSGGFIWKYKKQDND